MSGLHGGDRTRGCSVPQLKAGSMKQNTADVAPLSTPLVKLTKSPPATPRENHQTHHYSPHALPRFFRPWFEKTPTFTRAARRYRRRNRGPTHTTHTRTSTFPRNSLGQRLPLRLEKASVAIPRGRVRWDTAPTRRAHSNQESQKPFLSKDRFIETPSTQESWRYTIPRRNVRSPNLLPTYTTPHRNASPSRALPVEELPVETQECQEPFPRKSLLLRCHSTQECQKPFPWKSLPLRRRPTQECQKPTPRKSLLLRRQRCKKPRQACQKPFPWKTARGRVLRWDALPRRACKSPSPRVCVATPLHAGLSESLLVERLLVACVILPVDKFSVRTPLHEACQKPFPWKSFLLTRHSTQNCQKAFSWKRLLLRCCRPAQERQGPFPWKSLLLRRRSTLRSDRKSLLLLHAGMSGALPVEESPLQRPLHAGFRSPSRGRVFCSDGIPRRRVRSHR